MQFASDLPPGPNLHVELTAAGVTTTEGQIRWKPASEYRPQSVIELVHVEEGTEVAAIAAGVIGSYVPDPPVQPGPTLEDRVTAVEAWIAAHDHEVDP